MENNKEYKILKAEDVISGNFSIEALDIRHYIPFNEKRRIIYAIIDTLLLEDDGMVFFDEMDKFVTFIMVGIDSYVKNIDFEDKYIESYDALTESGTISKIMDAIGADFIELKEFFEMECNSRLEQNSIENVLNRKLADIDLTFATTLSKGVEQLGKIGAEILKQADTKTIVKMVQDTLTSK